MKRKIDSNYKIAAYVRVSTQRQALVKEGSLKNQEERIRGWFDFFNSKNGFIFNWDQNVVIYREEGKSAKDVKQRPQFQKMVSDIHRGQIHNVVVASIDRIFRNIRDALDFITLINKINVDFTSLKENFDTSSATGRAFLNIMMVFAQMEREQTSERVRIGNRQRVERGLWTFARVPYGYEMDKNKNGALLILDSERAGVEMAFQNYLKSGSIRGVAKLLNNAGFRTKIGTPWKHDTIYRMLTNKAYLGLIQINKRNIAKDKENVPELDRYKEGKGNWDPIIDEDIFYRVQEILVKNYKSRTNRMKEKPHPYLFQGGILQCHHCGGTMAGTSTKKNGKKYFYYYCEKCRFQTTAVRLDEIIKKVIYDFIENESVIIKKALEKVNERKGGDMALLRDSMSNAKKILFGIQKKIEVKTVALGNTDNRQLIEKINEELTDLLQEEGKILAAIQGLEKQIEDLDYQSIMEQALKNVKYYRKLILSHITPIHLREIVHLLFSRIQVGDNYIKLGIRGEVNLEEFSVIMGKEGTESHQENKTAQTEKFGPCRALRG